MPHKLLLADDSVTIQRVIELTFADEDVEVLTAGDGEQAIASIQADRPDIVLADVGMPKRSGYDVAAFVKGAPELSHIPVLLLTGAFEPIDERRAQAAGCDGVLVKPFEPQHVIARVRELLHRVPGASAARPTGSVTRAVSDVPRPVERLASQRAPLTKPSPASSAADVPRSSQQSVRPGTDLDDYFDRLDAAFANMATTADAPAPRQPEVAPRREGPVMERDLDWFDHPSEAAPGSTPAEPHAPQSDERRAADVSQPVAPLPDPVPVTFANPPASSAWSAPQLPPIEPPDSTHERAPQPAAPAPPKRAATGTGSVIADAFAALLAAEQGETDVPPVPLPRAGAPAAAPAAVTDELLNEITRRVVERLGSHAVHDLVADVVSSVAERLVREEIERIRNEHS